MPGSAILSSPDPSWSSSLGPLRPHPMTASQLGTRILHGAGWGAVMYAVVVTLTTKQGRLRPGGALVCGAAAPQPLNGSTQVAQLPRALT